MSSRFNILLHGDLNDVLNLLDPQGIDADEVTAVLANLIRNIQMLEKQVKALWRVQQEGADRG